MGAAEGELIPVHLSERDIAPPSTISAAARAALSTGAAAPRMARPDPSDLDAWREAVKAGEAMWGPIASQMLAQSKAEVKTETVAGATAYIATPAAGEVAFADCVYLYFHGGAFVFGGGLYAMARGAVSADRLGLTTMSVDYRMPPDHPFPAALEDCFAVYRSIIERYDPQRVAIGGSSAGGNLAAATTLMIRDKSLPPPAATILLTPEVDLTEAGDTFRTNTDLDVTLKTGLADCNALYAAGHDLRDPYVSPLFADFEAGFPPTLIQSGTRDLFLSNSVLLHRKLREAGVEAELHVWEAMPHGGFGFGETPEGAEIYEEVRRFLLKHLA